MVRHDPLGRRLESWFGFGIKYLLLLFSSREVRSLSKYSSSSILLQGGRVFVEIFFFFYCPLQYNIKYFLKLFNIFFSYTILYIPQLICYKCVPATASPPRGGFHRKQIYAHGR